MAFYILGLRNNIKYIKTENHFWKNKRKLIVIMGLSAVLRALMLVW